MSTGHAYLSAMAYSLGDLVPVASLADEGVDQDTLALLESTGLSSFSRSERDAVDLALDSAARTLERTSVKREDIDAVFLATESFYGSAGAAGDPFKDFRQSFYRGLDRLGLTNAYPCSLSFSGCSNLLSALAFAALAVESDLYRHVLVVATDRYGPGAARLVPPAVAVLSDGAASGLVGGERAPGFCLGRAVTLANLKLHAVGETIDLGRQLIEVGRSVKELRERMRVKSGRTSQEYRSLVLNNYCLSTVRMFAQQLGFDLKRVYRQNIARLAHVSAADVLINLADLWQEGQLETGARVMAFASGPVSWSLVEMETSR